MVTSLVLSADGLSLEMKLHGLLVSFQPCERVTEMKHDAREGWGPIL